MNRIGNHKREHQRQDMKKGRHQVIGYGRQEDIKHMQSIV
jgi:hypothetical protein